MHEPLTDTHGQAAQRGCLQVALWKRIHQKSHTVMGRVPMRDSSAFLVAT